MTDTEMTRLCAEAMGYEVVDDFAGMTPPVSGVEVLSRFADWAPATARYRFRYNPLDTDAHAMGLVKKFSMRVHRAGTWGAWVATVDLIAPGSQASCYDLNGGLNRAIVECVAKMQATLPTPANV